MNAQYNFRKETTSYWDTIVFDLKQICENVGIPLSMVNWEMLFDTIQLEEWSSLICQYYHPSDVWASNHTVLDDRNIEWKRRMRV
jgi:hypothetical protein